MNLGKALVDELRGGAEGVVEAESGGIKARAEVVGSGKYGSELRGLSVERAQTRDADPARQGEHMTRAVEQVAEAVRYLSEPLQPLELDAASGRGILRTRRDRVRNKEYYEVAVDSADRIDVGRFRYNRDTGGRDRVTENYGHGILERLVDDLAGIVGD